MVKGLVQGLGGLGMVTPSVTFRLDVCHGVAPCGASRYFKPQVDLAQVAMWKLRSLSRLGPPNQLHDRSELPGRFVQDRGSPTESEQGLGHIWLPTLQLLPVLTTSKLEV